APEREPGRRQEQQERQRLKSKGPPQSSPRAHGGRRGRASGPGFFVCRAGASYHARLENSEPRSQPMGFSTKQVDAGGVPDPVSGSILTPIYQSTTFVQESVDQYLSKGFSYSRSGNPTVRALEQKLAALENGVGCTCYSTGMAAEQVVFQATLSAGDHAV